MAGRIRAEDITAVKERSSIEDVVRDHVTLRPAGVGSLKGLCPFHDEKTPSFTVRPAVGAYHCFGCGEGGDVISFVQKVEHLTFTEAVERLAAKVGMELHYEEGPGGGRGREEGGLGRRTRLVEAHRAAQEFYAAALRRPAGGPGGPGLPPGPRLRPGRRGAVRGRVRARGAARSSPATCAARGSPTTSSSPRVCPGGGAGGSTTGSGGGWSGRSGTSPATPWGSGRGGCSTTTGSRRSTSTPPRRRSTRSRPSSTASTRRRRPSPATRTAVVVEGYTDVMAAHLAGVESAVATCGTAFGVDHIKILRRIMRDEAGLAPGQGRLHLRRRRGRAEGRDEGVRRGPALGLAVLRRRRRRRDGPVRAARREGRRGGPQPHRGCRPDVRVRRPDDDRPLRPRHRGGAGPGDAGGGPDRRVDPRRVAAPRVRPVRRRLARGRGRAGGGRGRPGRPDLGPRRTAARRSRRRRPASTDEVPEPSETEGRAALPTPDLRDPVVVAERQLLQALLQYPTQFGTATIDAIDPAAFTAPAHRAVFDGVRVGRGPRRGACRRRPGPPR